jgi:hypothetical protein
MTVRPIPFSAPMVRALRDGRKTQTRRALRPQPPEWAEKVGWSALTPGGHVGYRGTRPDGRYAENSIPLRFAVGDLLWVREAWRTAAAYDDLSPSNMGGEEPLRFEADGAVETRGWPCPERWGRLRAGIHLPRWASRLVDEVVDVRVERLQDISEADALAEGVRRETVGGVRKLFADPEAAADWPDDKPLFYAPDDDADDALCVTAAAAYARLWDRINGPRAWDDNPWVAAVSFRVHAKNVDALLAERASA